MNKSIKTKNETITRRDFLKGAAYGTLGITLGLKNIDSFAYTEKNAVPFSAEKPESKVVLIRHQAVINKKDTINQKIVSEMIDTALKTFSGEEDALKAWRRYIRPEDTVGVKFTHCDWMRIPTEQAVIDAILKRISDLKVPESRIYAQDGDLPLEKCTILINVPTVKVHTLTGIAASLKNYINFSKKPGSYHHDGSANLGEVWLMPHVKGKTKLIIVDLLRPYFGPGPQINPLHRWNYNGILVGTDPVAIDTVCTKICQVKRNLFKEEEWLLTPPPKSIATAETKYRLGTSNPLKIKLIRLGWEQNILI